jgi:hypothetical protein
MLSMKNLSQPGVNYLVKHVGNILRRLFTSAIEDVKQGHPQAHIFKLLPAPVEGFVSSEFDSILWSLMETAARNIHCALAPTFCTVNSSLLSFRAFAGSDEYELVEADGAEVKSEQKSQSFLAKLSSKLYSTIVAGSESAAKDLLRAESKARANAKMLFLPEKRTAMITEDEIKTILQHSLVYMYRLMVHNQITIKFHIDCYLYVEFKEQLEVRFLRKGDEANWAEIVKPDPNIAGRIDRLNKKIEGVNASLQEVDRLNQSLI